MDAQHSDSTAASTSTTVRGEPTDVGLGSWDGARTTEDGSGLVIVIVGSAPYDANNPCTAGYRIEPTETDAEVRVRFFSWSPPRTSPTLVCNLAGYEHVLTTRLKAPVGQRPLIETQFNRVKPVFDGTTLASVTWLPDGWEQRGEGAGYPDLETARYWARRWGPPPRAPTGDACTPPGVGLMLTEGPSDVTTRYPTNGEKNVRTVDVHGSTATYSRGSQNGVESALLTWAEGNHGFVLQSYGGCATEAPPPESTMVEFARSLAPR